MALNHHRRITGHLGELCKTAVTLRTKIPTGIGLVVGIGPHNRPHQDPLADAFFVNACAYRDNLAAAVCALNARKRHWNTTPTGILVLLRIKDRCRTLRLTLRRFRVPAHPRIDVGVVHCASAHTNQDFSGQGHRHRQILPILKTLRAAKTGQHHALHGGWDLRSLCHAYLFASEPLWVAAKRSRGPQTLVFQSLRVPTPTAAKAQQPMAQTAWRWALPYPH